MIEHAQYGLGSANAGIGVKVLWTGDAGFCVRAKNSNGWQPVAPVTRMA
jgi:hypothetical protein